MRLAAILLAVGALWLAAASHRPPVCIRAHRTPTSIVCDAYAAR